MGTITPWASALARGPAPEHVAITMNGMKMIGASRKRPGLCTLEIDEFYHPESCVRLSVRSAPWQSGPRGGGKKCFVVELPTPRRLPCLCAQCHQRHVSVFATCLSFCTTERLIRNGRLFHARGGAACSSCSPHCLTSVKVAPSR